MDESNNGNTLPAPGQNRRNKKPPKFAANENRIDRHLDPDGDVATHDASLLEMAGTKDPDLMCYLVGQAADAIQRTEKPQADILNKAVAALAGIGPRDELESMPALSPSSCRIDRLSALASAEYKPCFQFPRRARSSPSGVRGPVLLPPCNRQRPFFIAG